MSSTYQPGFISESDVASAVLTIRREFGEVKRGLEDAAPYLEYVILHAEPARVRAGMVAYADGTDWNPGSGEGIYRRNVANTAWVHLG